MYLKSLEIQGFKSFPDKTVLNFGADITAIVGPNGSGKSNLSDAIRWVMGEQNTRTLRGARMEDVIFGGTQKRSQVGFAEASLIFDNSDGAFPMESAEIMVTRRYFRSGESEYYINRQSARLKDVNELFMDTGLGREGYSNISQGRIDEILSLKSTDRREIFEEAAGISKYRHRKEETERRLQRTEENLLRIGDKVSELELQIGPLKEQAATARKYLALRDELKGLEIAVWLQSLDRLTQSAKKAEADYASAKFILTQAHEDLESLYRTAEELTERLHSQDQALDRVRERISLSQSEEQRLAGQLTVLEGEERNALDNVARLQQELDEQAGSSGGLISQIRERETRLAQIDAAARSLDADLQKVQAEVQAMTESSEGITKQYLQLRSSEAACAAQIAGRQADLSALAEASRQTAQRETELKEDKQAAAARQAETETRLSDCRTRLEAARQTAQSVNNTLSGYALRQKTRTEKAEKLQRELQDLSVELETVSSRLRLFREMEREYEGYSKSVKFIMQQAAHGALQNIHGPISRLIRTTDRCSVAIEIALGAATQHVVVSTQEDGKRAIRLLKARDQGRATFLPLSAMEVRPLNERGLDKCAGYVGVASELVSFDPAYRPAVENLLGRTVVCQTLDDAVAMAKQYHSRFRIVTLDGQLLNPGGSMTGGSVNKNAGVLSRANEITRLTAKQTELQAKKQELQKAHAEALRAAEEVSFALTAVQTELREAEDAILRLEGEEKQYAVLADAIRQAAEGNDRELEALARRRKTDSRRVDALKEELAALEAERSGLEAQLDALSVAEQDASAKGTELTDRLTALKMQRAALDAEKLTAMDTLRRLGGLAEDMQGDRSRKLELISGYEAQAAGLREQMQKVRQRQQTQQAQTEAERQALQQALDARAAVEADRTLADRSAQQKNKDIIDMERECARLESRKNAAELEERQIIDRLWDSYALTPSSAAAAAADIDSPVSANRRIAELRKQIHSLGTPNLGAIDEYARVSERYDYLTSQRDDVLQSKKELEGIIRDITRHMTEIFTTEFAKIDRYFGQTFAEMFGGGKASLELEDPGEPLTCGIEIRVQPPGKQLKTITLLSGGEKAFVAIALYFAILKVRPTPFCMLDEIDAALDDPNVRRFAGYLRQLCGKTQFIVITHRRGTMEQADTLFGVTMQEQGVSKILQLDLNQMEQQLGIDR